MVVVTGSCLIGWTSWLLLEETELEETVELETALDEVDEETLDEEETVSLVVFCSLDESSSWEEVSTLELLGVIPQEVTNKGMNKAMSLWVFI